MTASKKSGQGPGCWPWIAVVLLTLSACSEKKTTLAPGSTGSVTANASASGSFFRTPFHSESEYIVYSIAADISEMSFYAKNHALPKSVDGLVSVQEQPAPVRSPKFKITVHFPKQTLSFDLEINESNSTIWSPETYKGFAASVFKALEVKARTPATETETQESLAESLLHPTAENLETQDQRLSQAMERDFTDPGLHEQAGLLLGSFALRENSGNFFDNRAPLCRMAAHLTMARALGGGASPGTTARLAEALLLTLMNNQSQALEKISALDTSDPTLLAWARALQARNTHDFRPLQKVGSRSILERTEYFRALCDSVGTDVAWQKLSDREKIESPEPSRIVKAHGVSVGLGHEMLDIAIPLEIQEETNIYSLALGRPLPSQKEFLAALNELPARCIAAGTRGAARVQVIGWGQWAGFFQRHLCQAIASDYHFMKDLWGVPDEARDFSEKCDETFASLRFYPFVRRQNSKDGKAQEAACEESVSILRATPQLVPPQFWSLVLRAPFTHPTHELMDAYQHLEEWYSHYSLPGTAYNQVAMDYHASLVTNNSVELMQWLHRLAPYDRAVVDGLMLFQYHANPTYEQEEALLHPVLEYDTIQMYKLAQRATGNPPAYESLMARAAALNPAKYFTLGDYFRNGGNDEKAIAYFEQGRRLCEDSVLISYYAGWMVKYYLKQGQTTKASEIADFAAEVYSSRGLEAKAEFLEATGRYDEALEYYKKIEERYNDSSSLISFCLRYRAKTGRTNFEAILQRLTKNVFPNGAEHIALPDLKGRPRDGVLVGGESSETAKAGLHQGDIVVALNGNRVHNFEQYGFIRGGLTEPELDLIVWQGNAYHELKASPPDHMFGVPFPTFAAR